MTAGKKQMFRCLQLGAGLAVLVGLCWGAYSVVLFAKASPRFEVRKLSVSGLRRVDDNQVLAKAGFEVGTNVFKANLREIRERVEQIQWVRHALVERVLPDQIIIKVVEREPIGLGRIRGEIYQFDADAVILDPDPTVGTNFPILDGLGSDTTRNVKKVELYRKVLEDIADNSLSEIHISNNDEVSVVEAGDPMMVSLGTADYRDRWIRYLQLRPQIQQQYPQAVRVDLRFRNQVIVRMKDDETGEKFTWDVEKKSL
jgi:cell division septal protein FtsQ